MPCLAGLQNGIPMATVTLLPSTQLSLRSNGKVNAQCAFVEKLNSSTITQVPGDGFEPRLPNGKAHAWYHTQIPLSTLSLQVHVGLQDGGSL